MVSGHRLYIYSDSTFEYNQSGPLLFYTKGKWLVSSKNSIMLVSNNVTYPKEKPIVDTFFLSFDSVIVKIKDKDKVEMDNMIFKLRNQVLIFRTLLKFISYLQNLSTPPPL